MKSHVAALLAAPVLFAYVTLTPDTAAACGGCFTPPTENTQVSGHRMIVSSSMEATTLWDQISYSGSPESFAWVLPIKGVVDVGLSSDALFQTLDAYTQVQVQIPSVCDNPCPGKNFGQTFNSTSEFDAFEPEVEVLKQEVVGPYETVQLSSENPAALAGWLASHGYNVPDDVQPVIDGYVAGGFDFLALKLVPGSGVSAMRPVRITFPGGGFSLPLKMVAAGTGETTPIRLWVFGEGRYEPANFPMFTISEEEIVWDWDSSSSNYSQLRKKVFQDSKGFGWITDVATPTDGLFLEYELYYSGQLNTYADADGLNAEENLKEDLDFLTGGIPPGKMWITGLSSELSRGALTSDLSLNASLDQDVLNNVLVATNTTGTPPEKTPAVCPCDTPFDSGGLWTPLGQSADGSDSEVSGDEAKSGGPGALGCNSGGSGDTRGMVAGLFAAAALVASRRRNKAKLQR